jgi:SAM-dependent methyltransferase
MQVADVKRFVGRAYRRAEGLAGRLVFERRGQIRTEGDVQLAELGVEAPHRNRYEPSGWTDLRRVLRARDVRPGDVFVDFGSGKGRMVQMAARLPFARVVGVEIAEDLNQIARMNAERTKAEAACGEVEFVTSDAVAFAVPDDMTHAYFFNPFEGPVFEAVIANIIESLDRAPRALTLYYRNPRWEQCIASTGRFRRVRVSRSLRRNPTRTICVYVST